MDYILNSSWFDTLMMGMVMICFVIMAAIIVVLVVAVIIEGLRYLEWIGPGFEKLDRACWVCTKSRVEIRDTVVVIGKIILPQKMNVTVCDRWERIS